MKFITGIFEFDNEQSILEKRIMERDRMYKVAVVTAVYNVESYLKEMIESIIAQTIGFENIQLILVNDGSTDRSGEVCEEYARQYSDNIVVVHKENGGVSSARNEGLLHVRSRYVNFTDADDMLQENALQSMYDFLKQNEDLIDLCVIPIHFFGARSGENALNYRFEKGSRVVDLNQEYDCMQFSVSTVLVKRDCFNNRVFDEELLYAEDAQMVLDIMLDKMRIGVVYGTSYLYRKRELGDSAVDVCESRACYYIPDNEVVGQVKSSVYKGFSHLLSAYCNKSATNFERIIRNNTLMYVHGCANPIKYCTFKDIFLKQILERCPFCYGQTISEWRKSL